ncbi:MAG TPA: hypothetical protein PLM75_13485, partial [bacterium]|nr:hypothetical protein [bacterium]
LINDLKYDCVIGWFDGEDNCIKELVDAIKKEINAAILSKLILCISVKKIENFYLSDIEAFKSIILDPKNANDKSQTIITNFIAENNIEILREENCLDCYNFLGKYSDLYKSVNGSNKKFDKRTSAQKFFTNFKPENCIGSKSFSRMMDRLKNKIV